MGAELVLAIIFLILWFAIGFLPALIISGILSIIVLGIFGQSK